VLSSAAALLNGLFEHPAKVFSYCVTLRSTFTASSAYRTWLFTSLFFIISEVIYGYWLFFLAGGS
jgi:hypothetical protein